MSRSVGEEEGKWSRSRCVDCDHSRVCGCLPTSPTTFRHFFFSFFPCLFFVPVGILAEREEIMRYLTAYLLTRFCNIFFLVVWPSDWEHTYTDTHSRARELTRKKAGRNTHQQSNKWKQSTRKKVLRDLFILIISTSLIYLLYFNHICLIISCMISVSILFRF